MKAENEPEASPAREFVENRGQPRYQLRVDIRVHTRTCGTLKGHTVDISESGVSAIVATEVPCNQLVELDFDLPLGPVRVHAVVRQRNAFRYGFEFLGLNAVNQIIRSTCHQLAQPAVPDFT